MSGKTFAEKILGVRVGRPVVVGEQVSVEPDFILSHDDAVLVMEAFHARGAQRVWDPTRIVIALDHCVPAASERVAQEHKEVRELVAAQRLPHFFDVPRGICHQVLAEEGFALPGRLVLGTDRHTTTHGALGAYAASLLVTAAAAVWATGRAELTVPATLRVEVSGELPEAVVPQDLAMHLFGRCCATTAVGRCIELGGSTIRRLAVGGRMTLCNMAAAVGAVAAHVETDGVTLRYLARRARGGFSPVGADPDAAVESLALDVESLVPLVARPGSPTDVVEVTAVAGQPIQQAVLGTCTNGRVEDLWVAANRLRGRRVHPGVRFLVFPASSEVYTEALRLGLLVDLAEAGAMIMNPGCGPCRAAHQGVLAPGEVCVSTGNGNASGRMGSTDAAVYLASPETVAASALAGVISDPRENRSPT